MKLIRIALAAAVVPVLSLSLTGCGVGSAISAVSAVSTIQHNGLPFNNTVIQPGAALAIPSVLNQNDTAPVTTSAATITTAQEQNIVNTIGTSGHIKDLDTTVQVTSTVPDTKVGVVITQGSITNDQFWGIAGGSDTASRGTSTAPLGATITIHEPGKYVFGPEGTTISGYEYAGSVINATTTSGANITVSGFNSDVMKAQFETMVRSGQPITVYIQGFSPDAPASVTVDAMSILGHSTVSL